MLQDTVLPESSALLRAAFAGITLMVLACFVAGVYWSALRTGHTVSVARRQATVAALGGMAWSGLVVLAAARGMLRFEGRPPTMILLLVLILVIAVWISVSPIGRQLSSGLPVAALVGFQGFRVLVELAMHRAYTEGIMPVQMSYSGWNFDIVSGLTALGVAFWLGSGASRPCRPIVMAWNILGSLLLLNILVIALLSAPTPFRRFANEPANVWVTQPPFVWLPAVLVLAAILGHLLVHRRLRDTGV